MSCFSTRISSWLAFLACATLIATGSQAGPPFAEFVDPNPAVGNSFGQTVVALSTGNVVITSPGDDAGGTNAGAVYLFNGATGALISTLTGSHANDQVGSGGVTALSNGNYVVISFYWQNGAAADAGAVTWGSGTTGVSGVVSSSNSLVGSKASDVVGNGGVTVLSNGNYVVRSLGWVNGAASYAGAVTWGSGTTGVSGVVSSSNSLVGSKASDVVGNLGVTALSNGNYVVRSTGWDNGAAANAGAVTWGSGSSGVSGVVSSSNSLVGSTANDQVGSVVTTLTNGNYVVSSTSWDNGAATNAGAVTWGSGSTGVSGVVSSSNSLVGSTANDQVGSVVTTLTNGNYVVSSTRWVNGAATNAGAVTWGSGSTGVSGVVSSSNSLVGSTTDDNVGSVTALSNGNYVVSSPYWDNEAATSVGAVTWGSGSSGVSGVVSSSNSLVGSTAGDLVGYNGVTALSNGNYVVCSPYWDNGAINSAGAATWGSGSSGVSGVVSSSNSLVGSKASGLVGSNGVTALNNGNYVVSSPNWDNGAATSVGAVTWSSGTTGVSGVVSSSNSLVGSTAFDQVGYNGVTALNNGNYVVCSPYWDNGAINSAGAATWGSGSSGVSGVVSSSNSLVGSKASDFVGNLGVTTLSNGNYVVRSPNWDNGAINSAGAVTWGSGSSGVSGVVSSSNSLVGGTANDNVGIEYYGVTALSNGNYVVCSLYWDNGAVVDAGAVTWGSGTAGVSGVVSSSNSLVGSTAIDQVGNNGVTALNNGNYVVSSYSWDNGAINSAGAATWGSGTAGVSGVINNGNSLVGLTSDANFQTVVLDDVNGTFLGRFIDEGSGKVRVGSQETGVVPSLAVTSVAPPSGSTTGGTSVTITGTGFTGASAVSFGGTAAAAFTVNNDTSITATTPAHVAGAVSVLVTTPGGTNAPNTLYTYLAPPTISVTGNGIPIAHDDTSPSSADDTDFGSVAPLNTQVTRTFTISNAGDVALNLTGTPKVAISGDAGDFTVTALPLSPVAASGSTTFVISFDPSGLGTRSALVSIASDDPATPAYTFAIQGEGTAPEIHVTGNNQPIANGDTLPSSADHTDFGQALLVGGTAARTFTITNSGMSALNLIGTPKVAITGTHAAEFTVTAEPSTPVAAGGGSTTFIVTFDPSQLGLRQATVSIESDDSDSSPLTFDISGYGLSTPLAQTITFPELPSKLTTDTPFALGATVSSGLAVTYSIVSPAGIATVAGDTVTLSGTAGAVTVKASQAGDGTFDAAPEVYRSFVVGEATQRFVKLSRGYALHSAGIRADGTLWTWGPNGSGQLGDGTTMQRSSPVQVGSGIIWASVARGQDHTAAIRSDGTLWAWGDNGLSQLGDGTQTDRLTPVQVGSVTTWASVACGSHYTMAVRADGTLWAWGFSNFGGLGVGSTSRRSSPVQVGSATNWASVACGLDYTVAVRTDGTLWAWGWNLYGQVGDGTTTNRSSPVQVGSATNWAAIDCGQSFAVAQRTDGTLWGMGLNSGGQLGDGTTTNQFSPVQVGSAVDWASFACGINHMVAVRTDGTLWAWGANSSGEVGDGTTTNRSSPVQVGSETTWAAVAGGSGFTLGLRGEGALWAWGKNSQGELGNGTTDIRSTPVPVGSATNWATVACGGSHTLAVRTDGTLWAWGRNEFGILGDGTTTFRHLPVPVGSETNWALVACGQSSTVAARTDGTLWAWGYNLYGQVGDGTTTNRSSPVQVGSATNWASVACGQQHTVAVRTDGTLWAWGRNQYGQLGDGTMIDRASPVQVGSATSWASVTCGSTHTLAVRSDGTLWGWGRNDFGQLGDGTTLDRSSPSQIGSATSWASVAGGQSHTVAVRTDGTLWAWGSSQYGQLGDGTMIDRASPVQVGSTTNWASVTCGSTHTLAVRSDGTLWSWGRNDYGQLGNGTTLDRSSPSRIGSATSWASVACGFAHTLALRMDGTLWAWGTNSSGQLGYQDVAGPSRSWPLRADQTVSFALNGPLFPSQSISLAGSASSGLPILYTMAGPATSSGNILTATGLGTVSVTANQLGDGAWLPGEPVLQSVQVVPLLPKIEMLGNALPIANGDTTPSAQDGTDFGRVALLNTQVTRSFTIRNGGITALNLTGNPKVMIGGAAAADFQVTTLPQSPVAYDESTTFAITFDPSKQGVRTATVSIASDDPDDNPFTFAISGFGGLSTLLAQTIDFSPPAIGYVGNSGITIWATTSSGLPVTLTVLSGPAVLVGDDLEPQGIGTVKVQATQAGGGNFKPATPVTRTITIKPAPTTLTLTELNQIYNGGPCGIGTVGVGGGVDIQYKIAGTYGPIPPSAVGSYPVKATAGGVTKTGTLVIAKAPLYVTPDDQRKFAGRVNPELTFAYRGFLGGDIAGSAVTAPPTLTTTATTTSPGGQYPITAKGGTAANYAFVYCQGTLVVESFAGSYEALLVDGSSLPVGKLNLMVTAAGQSFTGKLYTAEEPASLPLAGTLATSPSNAQANGQTTALMNGIPYSVSFTLPLYGDVTASVTRDFLPLGTANDGRKLLALPKGKTVLYNGAHTAVLEPVLPAAVGIPAGAGWATATISTAGVMTLTGKLGDGQVFTQALTPDVDSDPGYRLFVQPYLTGKVIRTQSYLGGAFTLVPHPSITNRRYLEAATLTWKKVGVATDATYRTDFGPVSTVMMLDPWLPPVAAKGAIPAITLATRLGLTGSSFAVEHSDTGSTLNGNLPTRVGLSATNLVSVTTPVANTTKWKTLTFVTTTGTFTGSFELADTTPKPRAVTFSGVLRQPATAPDVLIGDGHYLLPPLSGTEKTTGEVMFARP